MTTHRGLPGLAYNSGLKPKGKQSALYEGNEDRIGYWITPPELDYLRVGRWDPCPYPRPAGWDGLKEAWEKPWYANPPFKNMTGWVRKAIVEGGPGVIVIPVPTALAYLVERQAKLVRLGRVKWLSQDGKRKSEGPEIIAAFIDEDPIYGPDPNPLPWHRARKIGMPLILRPHP